MQAVFCAALLAFGLALPIPTPETPNVESAILYEKTTDTVLYEKNADVGSAPASMTKVMTAILVLEHNPTLAGTLTVSEDAVSSHYCYWLDSGHLEAGEEISYAQCMDYLLIPSGNEAATAMGYDIADSVPKFVDMMNEKAAELGCTNTRFSDPHGLASYPQRTTPRDMLKIALHAMENDTFRSIVVKKSGILPASNMRTRPFRYQTTNRVMDPRYKLAYTTDFSDDVIGVKTGSTNAAGYCLAACMQKDGLEFYSVAMRGRDIDVNGVECQGDFIDTIGLFSYCRQFVSSGAAAGEITENVSMPLAAGFSFPIAAESELCVLVPEGEKATIVFTPDSDLPLPAKKGARVGTLTAMDAFGNEHSVYAVAGADVERSCLPYLLLGFAGCAVTGILIWQRRANRRRRADALAKQSENTYNNG